MAGTRMTNDWRGIAMGEIRSTFDIIMEKTRDLTMSDEQNKAFKEQQMAGKVRGLIQKKGRAYPDQRLYPTSMRIRNGLAMYRK